MGFTDAQRSEIKKQLEARKVVKVKILRSFGGDKRGIADEMAVRTGSVVVARRGNTVLLAKPVKS